MKYLNNLIMKYNQLSITKKSVLWFTSAIIIQNGIMFLVTPIYTRILNIEEYGIFSVYQSWQQIIAIIVILSLDRCITVGFMKFENEKKEFLSSVQTLMTILVLLNILLLLVFKEKVIIFINLPIEIIVLMFIVGLMNSVISNWSWLQRYNYNYKKLTFITVGTALFIQFIGIFSIFFIPYSNKGIVLIVALSISKLILYSIIYISVFKKGKSFYNKKIWKFSLRYSIPIIPHALSQVILNASDKIMIDKFCSREDVAFYSLTYSAAMVLTIVVTSISTALQPWFFQQIKEKEYKIIGIKTNLLLLIFSLIVVIASLCAPEMIKILGSSSYQTALVIFPVLALSSYFYGMYLSFANFESYYEKPIYFSIATTIGAILNIILNVIYIPKYGFIVAGYTTLLCYIVFAFMHYIFMKKICKEQRINTNVFDEKFIIILSFVMVVLVIIITNLYNFILYRYVVLVLFLLLTLIIINKNKKR